jgi:phosphotransferase system  glucose/maltose/N-acetylglucosamine-specific IIC component
MKGSIEHMKKFSKKKMIIICMMTALIIAALFLLILLPKDNGISTAEQHASSYLKSIKQSIRSGISKP